LSYRKQPVQADSLELLLDTICNMFGGIVFISLLVILMLQQSAGTTPEEDLVDLLAIEKLEQEVSLARSTNERVRQAREQQAALIAKYVPVALQESLHELESLSEKNAKLEHRSQALRENNLEKVKGIDQTQHALTASDELLMELQGSVEKLETEVAATLSEHSVAFPRASHVRGATAIQVSVRFGRLYFRHDLSQLRHGHWLPNLEDYVVTQNNENFYEVQVRPQAGLALADREQVKALLRDRLRNYPPARWTISISLWPESFQAFRQVRELLTELGYQFTVVTPDSAVIDRGGETRLFQ